MVSLKGKVRISFLVSRPHLAGRVANSNTCGQVFRCDVCMDEKPHEDPKVWRRKGDFNRHLKIHSNDK